MAKDRTAREILTSFARDQGGWWALERAVHSPRYTLRNMVRNKQRLGPTYATAVRDATGIPSGLLLLDLDLPVRQWLRDERRALRPEFKL